MALRAGTYHSFIGRLSIVPGAGYVSCITHFAFTKLWARLGPPIDPVGPHGLPPHKCGHAEHNPPPDTQEDI